MKVCTMKPTYFSPILLALAIIITTPLALVTSSFIVGISSAGALTTKPPYKFRKPPNNGAPGTADAGGSRGDCKVKNPILQAIAPIAPDKTVGGITASAQPDFWFSTTLTEDCATLEFVLKSDRGLTLYRGPVKMPSQPKPFAVQLPDNVSLKVGQSYNWYLLAKPIEKPPIGPSGSIQTKQKTNPVLTLNGSIQRIDAPEPTGKPILKAILYADQGIWHESASIVQAILCKTPDDPAALALWNAIVTDAGIRDLTKPEPLQP
jgi:Domain of Unknown Function (DUF928)